MRSLLIGPYLLILDSRTKVSEIDGEQLELEELVDAAKA